MKLDSEEQREILANCIQSAQITGMFAELVQHIPKVMEVLQAVQSAEIETGGDDSVAPKNTEEIDESASN